MKDLWRFFIVLTGIADMLLDTDEILVTLFSRDTRQSEIHFFVRYTFEIHHVEKCMTCSRVFLVNYPSCRVHTSHSRDIYNAQASKQTSKHYHIEVKLRGDKYSTLVMVRIYIWFRA